MSTNVEPIHLWAGHGIGYCGYSVWKNQDVVRLGGFRTNLSEVTCQACLNKYHRAKVSKTNQTVAAVKQKKIECCV